MVVPDAEGTRAGEADVKQMNGSRSHDWFQKRYEVPGE